MLPLKNNTLNIENIVYSLYLLIINNNIDYFKSSYCYFDIYVIKFSISYQLILE